MWLIDHKRNFKGLSQELQAYVLLTETENFAGKSYRTKKGDSLSFLISQWYRGEGEMSNRKNKEGKRSSFPAPKLEFINSSITTEQENL